MLTIVTPEEAGFASERLRDLDEAMQAYVGPGKVAGLSTLVVRRGQVVHRRCYGQINLALGSPVQSNSIFRVASLTKPITAVAALMLHDEGRFGLHDPVSRWIPELTDLKVYKGTLDTRYEFVELERELTFWHLLTHTAGFAYGVEPDDPVADLYREAGFFSPIFALQVSLPEMIRRLVQLPLVGQPGEAFHYSISYDVLGYLIELISGKPFDVYLREHIFEPLGMIDTGFWVPESKRDRFGPLYSAPGESGIFSLDEPAAGPYGRPGTVPSGGGGLASTLPDYFRFLSMLLNGGELDGIRLLEPSTVKQMLTNQVKGGVRPGQGYGFGVGLQVEDQRPGGLPQGVFGWGGGAGTGAWVYPAAGLITAIMYQAFAYSEPANRFRALTFAALLQ